MLKQSESPIATKARNVLFVLVGIAGLLLKRHYAGPFQELVYSYAGNFCVSFAVYFIIGFAIYPSGLKRLLTAVLALGVVEAFEAFNGFGIMSNTYDVLDFLANAAGIALAWGVDTILTSSASEPAESQKPGQ